MLRNRHDLLYIVFAPAPRRAKCGGCGVLVLPGVRAWIWFTRGAMNCCCRACVLPHAPRAQAVA